MCCINPIEKKISKLLDPCSILLYNWADQVNELKYSWSNFIGSIFSGYIIQFYAWHSNIIIYINKIYFKYIINIFSLVCKEHNHINGIWWLCTSWQRPYFSNKIAFQNTRIILRCPLKAHMNEKGDNSSD